MLLLSKKTELRRNMRKTDLQSKFEKLRYEALEQSRKNEVQLLIDLPLEEFRGEHMEELVRLVHLGETNAIIYLGNLIIDRFLGV